MSSDHSFILWFTGLSGSGKSTLAGAVADRFKHTKIKFEQLDGDIVRNIFPNTGFSKEERNMHIRRAGFLAGMLAKNGIAVICSFISPYREARQFVRDNSKNFIEIYVSTPLELCEQRDPKGLYKRVRDGKIKQFTGIDDPYEIPENPEITIDTRKNIEDCVIQIWDYLKKRGFVSEAET